jgi:hypothetical protein
MDSTCRRDSIRRSKTMVYTVRICVTDMDTVMLDYGYSLYLCMSMVLASHRCHRGGAADTIYLPYYTPRTVVSILYSNRPVIAEFKMNLMLFTPRSPCEIEFCDCISNSSCRCTFANAVCRKNPCTNCPHPTSNVTLITVQPIDHTNWFTYSRSRHIAQISYRNTIIRIVITD